MCMDFDVLADTETNQFDGWRAVQTKKPCIHQIQLPKFTATREPRGWFNGYIMS